MGLDLWCLVVQVRVIARVFVAHSPNPATFMDFNGRIHLRATPLAVKGSTMPWCPQQSATCPPRASVPLEAGIWVPSEHIHSTSLHPCLPLLLSCHRLPGLFADPLSCSICYLDMRALKARCHCVLLEQVGNLAGGKSSVGTWGQKPDGALGLCWKLHLQKHQLCGGSRLKRAFVRDALAPTECQEVPGLSARLSGQISFCNRDWAGEDAEFISFDIRSW